MTVNATVPVSGPITADGITRNWAFGFKISDATHLRLRITDADGISNPVEVSAGFTVAANYIDNDAGGIAVYPIAPTAVIDAGKKVWLYREAPFDQDTNLGNQGGYYPKSIERALDDLAMLAQQLNERLTRAAVIPLGSTTSTEDLVAAILALQDVDDEIVIVAGISGAVVTVAGISASVVSVAANMAAIIAAEANAASALASAGTATTQAGIATTKAAESAASALEAKSAVAALPYNFSTTTADADPGSGVLRINNADPALATAAYIDNTDADASAASGFLDAWDDIADTLNRGTLYLRSKASPAIRHIYRVTGNVVDGTGYRKVTLTYLGGAGAFTNAMPVWAIFVPAGAKGADGAGVGDVTGPAVSVNNRVVVFDLTTGKLIKDSGVLISDLATVNNAAFTGTFTPPDNTIALVKLAQQVAYTVVGVAGSSTAALNAIVAGANDRVLSRVSNALGFNQITAGMLPSAIITYAMITSSAIGTAAEYLANTASKLMSAAQLWTAAVPVALTDAATITANFNLFIDSECALAGNRALGAPSNMKNGQKGVMWFTATTSSRILTLDAAYLLMTGVEVGPYTITTTQLLGVAYVVRGGVVYVTAILRRG